MQRPPIDDERMMQSEHPRSDGIGKIVTNLAGKKIAFRLKDQDALGDGTVPAEASGNDPATQGVLQCFRMTGFDHQKSYANAQVRLVTLYSLCKLAQLSSLVQKE